MLDYNNKSGDSIQQSTYKNLSSIRSVDSPSEINTETSWGISDEFTNNPKTIVKQQQETSESTVSVFDVALYILKRLGHSCSTMKLHKLLYYCQAWSLVWDDCPLFSQKIEAWANGPVIRTLFNFHKGMYEISVQDLSIGDDRNLNQNQKDTINTVLDSYGNKNAQWLINQTHIERPWREARQGLAPDERGTNEISLESMSEYYSSLR